MSAGSVELFKEEVMIISEFLIRDGKFDKEPITKIMLHDAAQYLGYSGTRKLTTISSPGLCKRQKATIVTDLIIERCRFEGRNEF